MQENLVVVIAGPTASGKSQLAIDLAIEINGVIVNADSQQVYNSTPILSACPSKEDKAQVEHRLYEIFEGDRQSNVVEWLDLAVVEIKQIWACDKLPIVVGGTGLYIDNLINGTTPIPETSVEIRNKVSENISYDELLKIDPEYAKKISSNDTTRIRRALEVFYDTGVQMSEWHTRPMNKKLPQANFVVIKIIPNKLELDERGFNRFNKMLELGALDEVKLLKSSGFSKEMPAMKALGAPELMDYLDGSLVLEDALELSRIHTRQYAKRQITWFKNKLKVDVELSNCYLGDENVIKYVKKIL